MMRGYPFAMIFTVARLIIPIPPIFKLGLTGIEPRDLVLGTLLGMAPGAVLYVWAGSLVPSAEALERHELPGPLVWILIGSSFAAAAVIGVAAARRLRASRRT